MSENQIWKKTLQAVSLAAFSPKSKRLQKTNNNETKKKLEKTNY